MTAPLRIAVLGAGMRGRLFGDLLADQPHLAKVVAVAEPREPYREAFAAIHGLAPEDVFHTWQEFVAGPKRCDAVVIATMDRDHAAPAIACMMLGYDVLMEKPMAPTLAECREIAAAQRETGALVAVCHSLRYQKGFAKVKELLASGRIGQVMALDQLEQVGFGHFAHSYIRGNWGNAGRATPLLLAKSCHDLDYMAYLVAAPARRVSSFGSLGHFHAANAPEGSTARCLDGCAVESRCPYSALKTYVQAPRLDAWPASIVAPVHTREAHMAAIETGPYGRCVYRADNDVVDRQVVAIEFDGGVTATFTVTAFTEGGGRRLRVHGTRGELRFDERTITVRTFADGNVEVVTPGPEAGEHGGGDARVIASWLQALRTRSPHFITTDVQASLDTHAIAFAAEVARREGRVVSLDEEDPSW